METPVIQPRFDGGTESAEVSRVKWQRKNESNHAQRNKSSVTSGFRRDADDLASSIIQVTVCIREEDPAMCTNIDNPAAVAARLVDVQGDERWESMHQRFLSEGKDAEPEVLFIGDSIVQLMEFTSVWQSLIQPLHSLNFGIGGDQTQHVLWRVSEGGELAYIQPKVIVLHVGTNNHDHTAEQVVGGIMQIVQVICQKQPQAQLIVMGLLPRGEKPNPLREKHATINEVLDGKLDDFDNVVFFNVDPALFVNSEGRISPSDMYDFLHLTARGYEKLLEPLADEIQNLLQEFVKVENTSQDTDSLAGQLAGDN